ncbi:hypothetical protein V6N11_032397 [Hibiscus sabdariffa]|uniref:Uncharacterized protein n=1 Tax=Hibiscus sabdariffa TaxID=183260 RepID=A0ABR2T1A7_9ROSI
MLARCTSRTNASTTSDMGGRNSGSGCTKETSERVSFKAKTQGGLPFLSLDINWTQRAMTSEKRDTKWSFKCPSAKDSSTLGLVLWKISHI